MVPQPQTNMYQIIHVKVLNNTFSHNIYSSVTISFIIIVKFIIIIIIIYKSISLLYYVYYVGYRKTRGYPDVLFD